MLNTDHFILLAGEPHAWDDRLLLRQRNGESLTDIQEYQFLEGRRSAEVVKSDGGYYVCSATGLDGFKPLVHTHHCGGPLDGSLEAAIEWGKSWANEDPKNREFFARKSLLRGKAIAV